MDNIFDNFNQYDLAAYRQAKCKSSDPDSKTLTEVNFDLYWLRKAIVRTCRSRDMSVSQAFWYAARHATKIKELLCS